MDKRENNPGLGSPKWIGLTILSAENPRVFSLLFIACLSQIECSLQHRAIPGSTEQGNVRRDPARENAREDELYCFARVAQWCRYICVKCRDKPRTTTDGDSHACVKSCLSYISLPNLQTSALSLFICLSAPLGSSKEKRWGRRKRDPGAIQQMSPQSASQRHSKQWEATQDKPHCVNLLV